MTCLICDIVQKKVEAQIIYEDEDSIIFLHPEPAVVGHVLVAPKQHFPIFEITPDPLTAKLFLLANKMSSVLFDAIGSKGTNILVNNGINQDIPHFFINIISRTDGDGLIFDWLPKQMPEEEMNVIETQLKVFFNPKKSPSEEKKVEIIDTTPKKEESIPSEINIAKEETENKNTSEENKDTSEENKNTSENKNPEEEKSEEENYLVKQLKRMP